MPLHFIYKQTTAKNHKTKEQVRKACHKTHTHAHAVKCSAHYTN